MYSDKINMRSPLNYNTLEFIRKKEYDEQKNTSKLKNENKRGKRLKAYVVLTISLLFGFYAVMGVSIIASEYNIATSYFGASALVALSQASAATGFVITASGAVISAILPILLTYLAALGSA